MDAKLNHSDLTQILSKEADITMAKAEVLTKAFFDLIIEGLEEDGIVKINGLGTFKITEVADRSSVNVNTGEKFEIKGHNKLTFVPTESLKENVNQPFAMFEPVEVNSELSEEELLESEETETVEPAEEVVADESVASDETQNEDKAEVENIVEAVVTERPEPVLVRVQKKDKGIKRDAPKKKRNYKPLYSILLVAIIAVVVYLVYSMDMISFNNVDNVNAVLEKPSVENIATEIEKPAEKQEVITVVNSIKNLPVIEHEEVYEFVMIEELASMDLAKITMTDTHLYQITGEWCRHKVTNNETLTKIALKHYGSKKLWPYLVKHNNFARPDAIRIGMEISIPKLKPIK